MKKIILLFLAVMIILTACTGNHSTTSASQDIGTPTTPDSTVSTPLVSTEASSGNPENDSEPESEFEQTKIIFKPCLAFDALTALSFR